MSFERREFQPEELDAWNGRFTELGERRRKIEAWIQDVRSLDTLNDIDHLDDPVEVGEDIGQTLDQGPQDWLRMDADLPQGAEDYLYNQRRKLLGGLATGAWNNVVFHLCLEINERIGIDRRWWYGNGPYRDSQVPIPPRLFVVIGGQARAVRVGDLLHLSDRSSLTYEAGSEHYLDDITEQPADEEKLFTEGWQPGFRFVPTPEA